MATHSRTLTWRIPWTIQSMELQRVMTERLSLSLLSPGASREACFQKEDVDVYHDHLFHLKSLEVLLVYPPFFL